MPALLIYHGGCFDGFTAAWVYSRFANSECEFYPGRYGDPAPEVTGRDVIMVDITYPRDVMFRMACQAASFVVLDHHKTAEKALDELGEDVFRAVGKQIQVKFDMERSGCRMMWDFVVDESQLDVADIVRYNEDRDLWRFALVDTEAYMASVMATPMTFDGWDALHFRGADRNISRGKGILGYIHEFGTKALAEARRIVWNHTFIELPAVIWSVNIPYMSVSEHLDRLLREKVADVVAAYYQRGDARWQFSLRSRPSVDCSVLAKKFGGGGHAQASGFDVAKLSEVFKE